jgi:hypothetical protein
MCSKDIRLAWKGRLGRESCSLVMVKSLYDRQLERMTGTPEKLVVFTEACTVAIVMI